MSDNQVTQPAGESPVLLYIGYALAIFLPIGAIILGFVARNDFRNTQYDGHCDNLIQMFWVSLVLGIAGGVLSLILVGYLLLVWVMIWYLVRLVMGLVALSKNEPYMPKNAFWF